MPIYEYKCGECDHRLEALQKVSEEPLRDCPECHQPALTKLISTVAFRLKGSGWYETDFKSDNRRNVADSDKAPVKDKDKTESKGGEKVSSKGGDGANSAGAKEKSPASKSDGKAAKAGSSAAGAG